MALEQNSLGLFYGDRKVMTTEEKMDEIRAKVERIKKNMKRKEPLWNIREDTTTDSSPFRTK